MANITTTQLKLYPTDAEKVTIVDLAAIERFDSIPFDPGFHALLLNPTERSVEQLRKALRFYDAVEINVVNTQAEVSRIEISVLSSEKIEAILIDPLMVDSSFDNFRDIVARLRAPEDGCPWDTKQTIQSLRKNLLEECYEALDAIDSSSYKDLEEELGDILLIIVMLARIGEEGSGFNLAGSIRSITQKMIRRHPHIFGEVEVSGVDEVFANWDAIKKQERATKSEVFKSLLTSVPRSAPGLSQAQQLQDRAARVGFDWPIIDDVIDKIEEEVNEVKQADDPEHLMAEIGDLFFVLVNFARWKKIDAEESLHRTNTKFRRRFQYIEERVSAEGKELTDKSLDELDSYWNEAKKKEGGS